MTLHHPVSPPSETRHKWEDNICIHCRTQRVSIEETHDDKTVPTQVFLTFHKGVFLGCQRKSPSCLTDKPTKQAQ
jgi:hypothetical protein